jgi:predicted ArsR family transcriptional regulator
VRLTRRLIDEIVSLSPEETAGRRGVELADLIFERMAQRLAHEYAPRIAGDSVESRVRAAATLLAEEGLDFEVVVTESEVCLLGRGCPCQRFGPTIAATVGEGAHAACEHDRRLLEEVVGVPVAALSASELPHDFVCGYRFGG